MPRRAHNFPLPQAHLIGLALGVTAEWVMRWALPLPMWLRTAGVGPIIGGFALAVWATRAAGDTDLADPDRLVAGWPYAATRNPMYVGWTLVYLGAADALASGWLLLLTPVVLFGTHATVRREEQRLLARFDPAYATYATEVRRYL
jgi:protein-S-isoprenylcysteine O-methyltransferase Ste14